MKNRSLKADPRAEPDVATRHTGAFARAHRHSRLVRVLRVGLPAIALVMVLVGVAVAVIARSLPADLDYASTNIEDGRLVMQDPRLTGSDSSDRPYSMVARRAIQAAAGSSVVDLEEIRAEIAVDDENTASVVAGNGSYDPSSEVLRLFDDITVTTTNGIVVNLSNADIDLSASKMTSNNRITIETPNQRLESGSVSIEDGGSRLTFSNRVKLTLLPTANDEPARP